MPHTPVVQPVYAFGFTAASLRPELLRVIAEQFLQHGSWQETRASVLSENALQCRTRSSSERLEMELRPRLQCLTPAQLKLLVEAGSDVRTCIAWLAAVRRSAFLFEFAAETLRSKLELRDRVLRDSDYSRFIADKSPAHPELARLTTATCIKIKQVLLAMLREVGILRQWEGIGLVQRPVIAPEVRTAIAEDDPTWLAAFLVPDAEIATL